MVLDQAAARRAWLLPCIVAALAIVGAAPADGAAPTSERATVFFLDGGRLAAAARTVPRRGAVAAALQALLRGPTAAERRAGLATAVPARARLLGVSVSRGAAVVRLSPEFVAGAASPPAARLAQVVFTLTAFEAIRAVRFDVAGKAAKGLRVPSSAVARAGYARYLPPILVEQPLAGERAASPLRLRGMARGRVTALLLDANGELLAKASTPNATGRTRFDLRLRFPSPAGKTVRLLLLALDGPRVSQLELLLVASGA